MFNRIGRRIRRMMRAPAIPKSDPTHTIDDTAILQNVSLGRYNSIGRNSHLINVEVGDYTYMAGYNAIMNTKIGKFCSIGQGVVAGPGKHPSSVFVSTSPVFFSTVYQCGTTFSDGNYFNETGRVVIGNDVWLGLNAVILDDVTIGDGAIVAAGAIVTKDVEPYSIVGGMPARLLKYRFEKDQIEFLLKDKWWDKDTEWLKANYKRFHDIAGYMDLVTRQL